MDKKEISQTDHPLLLHSFFEDIAQQYADKVAVEFIEKNQTLTYRELDRRATLLAHMLQKQGVGPNTIVGLHIPRGIEQYIAILGIMKAGGAYLALDIEFPQERIEYCLDDAGSSWVLTDSQHGSKFESTERILMCMDQIDWEQDCTVPTLEPPQQTDEDLCYVIYTSGTTGKPKGVCISHRNVVTFVAALCQEYGVSSVDRVLQGFSLSFDASVEELWMAFATGATLVVGTLELMRAADELPQRLEEMDITVLSAIPTLMSVVEEEELPRLQLMILGGEAVRSDVVKKWWAPHRRILNTYGPTECSVVATWSECHPDEPVTIGRALPGYQAFVVDEQLNEVPDGCEGELAIAGPGVSLRGYLNRPSLTAQKFITKDGRRLYRTGDLVYRNSEKNIMFCGRIDSQVKIRGFRVELEEIETHLSHIESCEDAILAVKKDHNNIQQLVAFIIQKAGHSFDSRSANATLRKVLPPYMLPTVYASMTMEDVPRMTSGKVDRRRLPELDACDVLPFDYGSDARIEIDPATDTPNHQKMRSIWQEVLQLNVGNYDSFFDLGGNSVSAARVISAYRTTPGLESLSIRDVYELETIDALVTRLHQRIQVTQQSTESESSGTKVEPEHNSPLVPTWEYYTVGALQMLVLFMSYITGAGILCGTIYGGYKAVEWLSATTPHWLAITLVSVFLILPIVALVGLIGTGLFIKRYIIGRFTERSFPIWSFAYFRWWLGNYFLAPIRGLVNGFVGSPLGPFLYRYLGANMGKNIQLFSGFTESDLVSIGEGTTISPGAALRTHFYEDGHIHLRPISIGKNVYIGPQTNIDGGVEIGDDVFVLPATSIPSGTSLPSGTHWQGSPAQDITHNPGEYKEYIAILQKHRAQDDPKEHWSRWQVGLKVIGLQIAFGYMFAILGLAILSVEVFAYLGFAPMRNALFSLNLYVLLPASLFFATFRFIALLTLIVLGKRLLGGIAQPGTSYTSGLSYVRRWFSKGMMGLLISPAVTRGVVETLLMPHVCRWMGMKVGKNVEISNVRGCLPELVELGEGVMLADACTLNTSIIYCGQETCMPIQIGARTFIGNGAYVPLTSQSIGARSLLGVLSIAPEKIESGSSWLGSPPMRLPRRLCSQAPDSLTFSPPKYMIWARAFFNYWKMVTPGALAEMLVWMVFVATLTLWQTKGFWVFGLSLPFIAIAASMLWNVTPVVLKWLFVGRYKPGQKYLWSFWLWRYEIASEVDFLVASGQRSTLHGTPFIGTFFRLMGAKIGRRFCLLGGMLMEADLIHIGDNVCIEGLLQTHLFEDRVMKLGPIQIGDGGHVGSGSCVLYDSKMGEGAVLDTYSLQMKNEVFLSHQTYRGLPAENIAWVLAPAQPETPTPPTADFVPPADTTYKSKLQFTAP